VKILVTGSQGFIGSYLCQELLKHGYEVVGVDNFSKYGRVVRPHDEHPSFQFVELDVLDNQFPNAVHGISPDVIVAAAAMIGGISYFHKYAYDLLATNERILASTFDAAIKSEIRRMVVISSSMVFENTTVYPTPEREITTCPPPLSTYGFQKLASEYFCKGAYEQYNLPYTIIRPFNCVGIGEDAALGEEEVYAGNVKMMMSHVLPDLIHKSFNLSKDDKLPILGKGDQIRHYTNGRDIARGIRLAIESPDAINQDFNISSPLPTSVKELATVVWQKIHGADPEFEHCEPFQYDVQVRSPDVSKARDILGFKAQIGLGQSIDEVINYMSKKH